MPERQCNGCKKQAEWGCRAKKIRDWDPKTMKGVSERDCWVNPSILPMDVDGVTTYACPRQTLYEEPQWWGRIFSFYRMYQKGFLPQAGAVLNQSARLIRIFGILDDINAECDERANQPKGPPQGAQPKRGPSVNRGKDGNAG